MHLAGPARSSLDSSVMLSTGARWDQENHELATQLPKVPLAPLWPVLCPAVPLSVHCEPTVPPGDALGAADPDASDASGMHAQGGHQGALPHMHPASCAS